mgnify:CR=1 FL=1
MSKTEQKDYAKNGDAQLFAALAENIKSSFITVLRATELAPESGREQGLIAETAQQSLELLDHYLLSLQLNQADPVAFLRPVSLSASLTDVAHQLVKTANAEHCDIELDVAGKYGPILAHPGGLTAALVSLGNSFIAAHAQRAPQKRMVIKLATYTTAHGVRAGLFTDIDGISASNLKRARKLLGKATSPFNQFTTAGDAGVFVADALLQSMSSGLTASRHHKLPGFAATFTTSPQLELV